jgi:hypothetical protein
MIGQKNYVGVHTTMKMIKLSFDDITITILKSLTPAIFFQSDDNDKFFDQSARVYKLSYNRYIVV